MSAFLSLFSGAGGLDLGLHRAGWECVGQCEADAYRRSILAKHWPNVPRWDDVATLDPDDVPGPVDLIAGGFPCQDVSVAGRRRGLAGERTGLFWEALRLVDAIRPRFILLENVVGLLSSNGGRDFATVVRSCADFGYGVAWRVLDSCFFGVPQRRRRVFIVGALPGGRAGAERAGEVLAVGSRCAGHPPAGSAARADDALRVEAGVGARRVGRALTKASLVKGGHDDTLADYVVQALDRQAGGPDDNAHTLRSEGFDASEDGTGRGTPLTTSDVGVRRLTPTECCRLQGFPDDWFGEPNRPPDGPRYAALGDAVTVDVAAWIGARLAAAAPARLGVAA